MKYFARGFCVGLGNLFTLGIVEVVHLRPTHAWVVLLQTFECEEFFFRHGQTVCAWSSKLGRVAASQTFEEFRDADLGQGSAVDNGFVLIGHFALAVAPEH